MDKQEDWAIIGGGMLGMTLALKLVQRGKKVTIYESAENAGGLASAWQMDDIVWDRFYHVILMSDINTRRIINDIGLEHKLNWVETKTGFYSDGKLYSMSNVIEFLKFPPINLIDKFRLGITILVASKIKNWKSLENIYVEDWLKKWSGKRVFEKIWLPLLRAKLGDNYRNTSATFIWATIQRMYAARRSGLKKEMFGYVSGGYDQVNTHFVNYLIECGVQFKYNSLVQRIDPDSDNRLKITLQNKNSFTHSHIISTLPSNISAYIAPSLTIVEKEKHNSIKYLGVICAALLLKRKISPYYVTNIIDSDIPFTGIIEMTSLIKPEEIKGRQLIYLPKYVNPDDSLMTESDEEIRRIFLKELLKMYPFISEEEVLFFGVSRAKHVFCLPTLKYSENVPGIRTSIDNYYIINSAQIINGTLNVNETIQVAENKIKEIFNESTRK